VPRSQLRIDNGAIDVMLRGPTGAVAQDLRRRGRNVRTDARRRVGVDTGRLRDNMYVELGHEGRRLVVHVGNRENYALVHHEGHGVIRPKRASVLVFNVGGRTVFTRRVRSVRGTFYLRRALRSAVR
jgi:hypothetical protein